MSENVQEVEKQIREELYTQLHDDFHNIWVRVTNEIPSQLSNLSVDETDGMYSRIITDIERAIKKPDEGEGSVQ